MGIVDFHSHILPGADHGSSSLRTSLLQLERALKSGVDRIVATPHFYPHRHKLDAYLERRAKAVSLIKERLTDIHPKIAIGTEVMFCVGFERFPALSRLCIGASNVMLFELPSNDVSLEYVNTAVAIKEMGYRLVLAHAERYPASYVSAFVNEGIDLQINALSLCQFSKRRELSRWFKSKNIVAFGSDAHGQDKRAYRAFSKAVRRVGDAFDYVQASSDAMWEQFETI